MTTQRRIIRAITTAVAAFLAILVGTYIKQVLLDGGAYNPGFVEAIGMALVCAVIGYFAPSPEQAKKNRENLFKK